MEEIKKVLLLVLGCAVQVGIRTCSGEGLLLAILCLELCGSNAP